ncbi:MAG: hypothetical protein R3F37_05170 [Candidatus Competibacteraceae bacterium]
MLEAFHSDTASALAAGHDVRTAVVAYAGDASHSIERHTHHQLGKCRALAGGLPEFRTDLSVGYAVHHGDDFSHQITPDNLPPVSPTRWPSRAEVFKVNRDRGRVRFAPFDRYGPYLRERLLALAIPSLTGFTDEISRVCGELEKLAIPYQPTRRGTIIAATGRTPPLLRTGRVNHLGHYRVTVSAPSRTMLTGLKPVNLVEPVCRRWAVMCSANIPFAARYCRCWNRCVQ